MAHDTVAGAQQAAQSVSDALGRVAPAGGGGGGGGGGADGDAAYHDVLQRVYLEQERLGQVIPHPF